MFRTVSLKISFIFLFFSSCISNKNEVKLPYYNTPNFTPRFFETTKNISDSITHTIPNFEFMNQNGKNISQKDITNKIHIANFIFTRCGSICPIMTKHLKLVQNEFNNNSDIVLLSYSVTPWIDSVARLKQFAQQNEIVSNNWHLLTGNKSEIYNLARQGYFAEEDLGFSKDSTDFLHTEHVLLIDKTKRIRGIYNGTLQLDIEQMIKDIKILLND